MLAAHVLDGVAYLMNNTELHGRIRKNTPYGVGKAFQAVHATYHDVLHTAVLKVRKHLQPEVGALAPGNVHAQQLLVPFFIDAQYIVDGTGDSAAAVVLDLVVDGI